MYPIEYTAIQKQLLMKTSYHIAWPCICDASNIGTGPHAGRMLWCVALASFPGALGNWGEERLGTRLVWPVHAIINCSY